MNLRMWVSALVCLGGLSNMVAQAQSARSADFIVAVVNSEPITNSEVTLEVQRLSKELRERRQTLPSDNELRTRVLERLIDEKAQTQLAADMGLRIDDAAVDQAEETVARQNQVSVANLRLQLAKDGIDARSFRDQLRKQLLLSRVHEREVEARIRISDTDVERYMADRVAENADPFARELNLAQILIPVSEQASAEQAGLLYMKAQKVLERIRAGERFETLLEEVSSGDRTNGGQMGLRRGDRYPPLFVEATRDLEVGQVSEVVRSGAGFHILKVLEKRAPTSFTQSVVQSRARHILLRPSPQLSIAQAQDRLAGYKRRIESGADTFQSLASQFSQDGSASQGGDLGWTNPGMFVPEFEEVMNRLNEGQLSQPLVSRFGVHLIQMVERRQLELGPREVRELVRSRLREARYEEAFANWAREVRGRAFVELRESPQ
ncbi:MAG: peptidylprolyl isomerase [Rhodoferax sp.]|nr:peptidylprolyl isomerase [Rhodoferax sp.]